MAAGDYGGNWQVKTPMLRQFLGGEGRNRRLLVLWQF